VKISPAFWESLFEDGTGAATQRLRLWPDWPQRPQFRGRRAAASPKLDGPLLVDEMGPERTTDPTGLPLTATCSGF
jgi:hypothetical protein